MNFGDIDFDNIDWGNFGRVRDYSDFGNAANSAIWGINLVTNLISIAIAVLMIIALWKVFKKAGKPGWHALIPFLNVYDLYIIAWKKKVAVSMLIVSICTFVLTFAGVIMFIGGLGGSFLSFFTNGYRIDNSIDGPVTMFLVGLGVMLLGACCSIVCLVFMIINYVKLGQAFGKSGGFLVGLALIPIVFVCILAFGDAQYQGYCDSEGFQPYTPSQTGSEIPEPPRYCSGCGTKIVPGSKFCNNCGKQLVK